MSEEKDYLPEWIAHDIEHNPGCAAAWAPYALMAASSGSTTALECPNETLRNEWDAVVKRPIRHGHK